jgi:exonuclease SbcC
VFDQLKIKQQTKVFSNEIASKSAIITNELSRLKVVSFLNMNTSQLSKLQKNKLHLENNWIALEHKSKSDAILLNQELAGLEASLK